MRITTLNDDLSVSDIEVPLKVLAISADPLEAACWQKILDLALYLRACGPDTELSGNLVFEKLVLYKRWPANLSRDLEVQKRVNEWKETHPDPNTWGPLIQELRQYYPPPGAQISIWMDWIDYAPVKDGIPVMHYRFQVAHQDKPLRLDGRAKNLEEARIFICNALGC